MSSVSANFGSEAMSAAMLKKTTDAQGQMAMALLSGAVQNAQSAQANAPKLATPAVPVQSAPAASGHVDTYA